MAEDDVAYLKRLERLERRLQALEDAEAIRDLKARYAALCDNHYDADGIAALFIPTTSKPCAARCRWPRSVSSWLFRQLLVIRCCISDPPNFEGTQRLHHAAKRGHEPGT